MKSEGMSEAALQLSHQKTHIPMFGMGNSLNVSTASDCNHALASAMSLDKKRYLSYCKRNRFLLRKVFTTYFVELLTFILI
ncbi:hypothetical protein A9Q74_00635 [Colwellia sp. 39_35_sub15_T18]|nr:hypothetical protein A9Q74_00635 [Colwellia sp. 39_35_sub15_T18]